MYVLRTYANTTKHPLNRSRGLRAALILSLTCLTLGLVQNSGRTDKPQEAKKPLSASVPSKGGSRSVSRSPVSSASSVRPSPFPLLASLEAGFTTAAERLSPSVVAITTQRTVETGSLRQGGLVPDTIPFLRDLPGFEGWAPQTRIMPQLPGTFRTRGAGSGVIVRSDGWILTNDHVVNGADKVTVRLHDGREFPGTVRRDYQSDLALVKINASGLVPAELGDSEAVRVGQWAVAFGNPFGLDETMTVGIISARARQRTIREASETRFYPSLLQTDAAVNPGNSGGPLADVEGRVIGINVAIDSPTGGNVGIGFAIPINYARDVMDQLLTKGKVTRGFLGVVPKSLTSTDTQHYGVREGALVVSVSEGTPAARAGIQVEDVILRYDGKPIRDELALREAVAHTAPGQSVDIVVRRDGRETTLKTRIEAVSERSADARPETPPSDRLGVRVEAITPETTRRYSLPASLDTGVVVVEVRSGSPAAEAGLQSGDVVQRFNRQLVKTPADLQNAVTKLQAGERFSLVVRRGDARVLLTGTF